VTSRSNEPIGFHSFSGRISLEGKIAAPRAKTNPTIAARARLLPPFEDESRRVAGGARIPLGIFIPSVPANSQSFQALASEINNDKTIAASQGWLHGRRESRLGGSQFLFGLFLWPDRSKP